MNQNNFQNRNKIIKEWKKISHWVGVQDVFSTNYFKENTKKLSNAWWCLEPSNDKGKMANDIQTFQEWISLSNYAFYQGFLNNLGVSTWTDFRSRVVTSRQNYEMFVSLLESKLPMKLVPQFISDVMNAIREYE